MPKPTIQPDTVGLAARAAFSAQAAEALAPRRARRQLAAGRHEVEVGAHRTVTSLSIVMYVMRSSCVASALATSPVTRPWLKV